MCAVLMRCYRAYVMSVAVARQTVSIRNRIKFCLRYRKVCRMLLVLHKLVHVCASCEWLTTFYGKTPLFSITFPSTSWHSSAVELIHWKLSILELHYKSWEAPHANNTSLYVIMWQDNGWLYSVRIPLRALEMDIWWNIVTGIENLLL